MRPTKKYENKLLKQGYKFIAGLDEAGRGSWAGPLVSGAVIFHPEIKVKIKNIKDSKLLSAQKREKMFLYITKNCLAWSVGIVSSQEIDNLGIIPANRLSFERAVKKLNIQPDYLLIDGLRNLESLICNEFVVKGDEKILSIASASIIAKVVRDQILNTFNKFYPEYYFHKHKGYGTKEHLNILKKIGPCEMHRFSFKPVSVL